MPKVEKSVLVPYSSAIMFDLVDDIERYAEFLPWCDGTTLIKRDDAVTAAEIKVNYLGIRQVFSTLNRKQDKSSMQIELLDGPFKQLSGFWRFTALDLNSSKVELKLDYKFSNFALEKLSGSVFEVICKTMIDRFVERAAALNKS